MKRPSPTWRDRLRQAVEDSGKSMREASIAAGCSPGYVFSILVDEKDPTIDKLLDVIRVIDASPSWIISGIDMSAADERRLKAFAALDKSKQAAVIQLAEAFQEPAH